MRAGLPLSFAAHALIIAWGVISLPSASPIDSTNLEQIPVDFIEIDDVTQLTRGLQTAALVEDVPPPPPPQPEPPPLPKPTPPPPPPQPPAPEPQPEPEPPPLPTPAPPPPTPEPPPPPPAPSPEAVAPPPPEEVAPPRPMTNVPMPRPRPPKPQQQVAEVPKPETPEPEPPPEPQPEPEDPFNVDELTAMLDQQPTDSTPPEPDQQPTVGAPDAPSNVRMTANELDLLRSRLAQCWSPPIGYVDPAEVRVVLLLSFNPDGSLAMLPQVVEGPQGQFARQAPESAIRAVRMCAPYNLPADKYDAWREVKVTFDPRDMDRI